MIKVLHVITDTNIGGAGILLKNLISYTDKKRICHSVTVPKGSALIPLLSPVASVYEADVSGERSLHLPDISKYRRLISKIPSDIVHTHGATSARIAAKRLGKITVMTRHCAFEPRAMSRFPFRQINSRLYGKYTDLCIATAEAARQNLLSMGVSDERIRVIINASPPQQKIGEDEKRALRESLGISEGDLSVGMVARLEEYKGHKTVIDAARALSNRGIKFFFLGTGSMEKELKEYAGAVENVEFLGFAHDVYRYLNIFDVLVNASTGTETSCLAISEAMSLGVVCVVSDFGGNPYMVDENSGFVFPMKNSRALADILLGLKENPDRVSTLSAGARARYLSHFTPQRMANEYADAYEALLCDRRKQSHI